MSRLHKLLCWLGLHGPVWFGHDNSERSRFAGIYVRRCVHCGARWQGEELGGPSNYRDVGWRRIE